jgi:hypothetical protein
MILLRNGWIVEIVREGLDFLLYFLDLRMEEAMEGKAVTSRKMGPARDCGTRGHCVLDGAGPSRS